MPEADVTVEHRPQSRLPARAPDEPSRSRIPAIPARGASRLGPDDAETAGTGSDWYVAPRLEPPSPEPAACAAHWAY